MKSRSKSIAETPGSGAGNEAGVARQGQTDYPGDLLPSVEISHNGRITSVKLKMKQQDSRRARLLCRIDVTGFASILFALLAMFMAPRLMTDLPVIQPVDLPKARHSIEMPGVDREDALVVAVSRDGRIYFDTTQIGADDLPPRIREKLKLGAPPEVYLRIDARARYRAVAKALDGIRHAGVEKIGFITNSRRQGYPEARE